MEADFEGGFLSSDGGSLFPREIDCRHRFMKRLAECFDDRRDADRIEHSVEELLKQRIFGLALGYEDLNDHDRLRHDPLLAVSCGKADPLGLTRREERDRGKAPAGKATLNRMELAIKEADGRYKKIVAAVRKRFGANKKILEEELEEDFVELEAAREEHDGDEGSIRRFKDFTYQTHDSWSRSRRVVGKAELTHAGRTPRFVVTNLPGDEVAARRLYEDIYCARGEMENQIKVQQMDLFADRASTRLLDANQLRLWYSAFAHLLVETLRGEVLKATSLADATIGQIRLRFFKLAARVKVSCRRVLIEWCTACPNPPDYVVAHAALGGG